MNEKMVLRFVNGGESMKVKAYLPQQGVLFEGREDDSPLTLALGLQPLLPGLLDPVCMRNDWRFKEFSLDVSVQEGCLLLSGYRGDPGGLPCGAYDVSVELESYRFVNSQQRLVLQENETKTMVLSTKPDARLVCVKENNFDDATKALVDQSRVNGVKLWDWLTKHRNPQEVRKACLLNILTKLAATRALTTLFTGVHLAAVDRIYASAVPNLLNKLEDFVGQGTWVAEGRPKAAIHQRVVTDALRRFYPNKRKTENDFTLRSYRQGGRNCLQIVVAQPAFDSSRVFADLDIDLGNPLWDLEGCFVHLGELLDTGYTDHFALRSKLVKAGLGEYMFYDIKAR